VDPTLPVIALERATALLMDIVGGEAGPVQVTRAELAAEAPAFLAVGVAFFTGPDAALLAVDVVFFVTVAAFFTTGAAFFLVRAGRLPAVAPTRAAFDLFPGREVALERDADPRLAGEPLLAGVILPSFGPPAVAAYPCGLALGSG